MSINEGFIISSISDALWQEWPNIAIRAENIFHEPRANIVERALILTANKTWQILISIEKS